MNHYRLLMFPALVCALAMSPTASAQGSDNPLLNPASLTETAPDSYQVNFDTSKGSFVVQVTRGWAPHGADRFYNLVKGGYYDGCRFFRVIPNFMAQFGLNGDPEISKAWRTEQIPADPVEASNRRGFITFAMGGSPDTRTTQVFINFSNNRTLDASGFAPFGEVVSGMDVVDDLYDGYGDGPPRGRGPDQVRFNLEGNAYLDEEFPRLDYINRATIIE